MKLKISFDVRLEKKEAIYWVAVLVLIVLVINGDIVAAMAYIGKLISK